MANFNSQQREHANMATRAEGSTVNCLNGNSHNVFFVSRNNIRDNFRGSHSLNDPSRNSRRIRPAERFEVSLCTESDANSLHAQTCGFRNHNGYSRRSNEPVWPVSHQTQVRTGDHQSRHRIRAARQAAIPPASRVMSRPANHEPIFCRNRNCPEQTLPSNHRRLCASNCNREERERNTLGGDQYLVEYLPPNGAQPVLPIRIRNSRISREIESVVSLNRSESNFVLDGSSDNGSNYLEGTLLQNGCSMYSLVRRCRSPPCNQQRDLGNHRLTNDSRRETRVIYEDIGIPRMPEASEGSVTFYIRPELEEHGGLDSRRWVRASQEIISSSSSPALPRHQSQEHVGAFRGVPNEIIEMLPVERFDKSVPAALLQEFRTCLVCQLDYCGEEQLKRLPCIHRFHAECIDRWLVTQERCPVCRMSVIEGLSCSGVYFFNEGHQLICVQHTSEYSLENEQRNSNEQLNCSARDDLIDQQNSNTTLETHASNSTEPRASPREANHNDAAWSCRPAVMPSDPECDTEREQHSSAVSAEQSGPVRESITDNHASTPKQPKDNEFGALDRCAAYNVLQEQTDIIGSCYPVSSGQGLTSDDGSTAQEDLESELLTTSESTAPCTSLLLQPRLPSQALPNSDSDKKDPLVAFGLSCEYPSDSSDPRGSRGIDKERSSEPDSHHVSPLPVPGDSSERKVPTSQEPSLCGATESQCGSSAARDAQWNLKEALERLNRKVIEFLQTDRVEQLDKTEIHEVSLSNEEEAIKKISSRFLKMSSSSSSVMCSEYISPVLDNGSVGTETYKEGESSDKASEPNKKPQCDSIAEDDTLAYRLVCTLAKDLLFLSSSEFSQKEKNKIRSEIALLSTSSLNSPKVLKEAILTMCNLIRSMSVKKQLSDENC